MFHNVEWLFFDLGSTILNEDIAHVYRIRDIAALADVPYKVALKTTTNFAETV